MQKASLGDRMKTYEGVTRTFITRRTPAIIRLDGVAFHTFTRGMKKPVDSIMMETMWKTTQYLCQEIQGCKLGYTQSDEISLLLVDYDTLTTAAWFDKNVSKMISVSASIATMAFNYFYPLVVKEYHEGLRLPYMERDMTEEQREEMKYCMRMGQKSQALFDSRVFTIPKEEVCNYFIWRQQDATRNAIESLGQSKFSAKQLHKKNCNMIQEMLFQEYGINFNDCPVSQKRGICTVKESYTIDDNKTTRSRWIIDENIPVFTKDREYIEKFVNIESQDTE